jgi:hypothetical protein
VFSGTYHESCGSSRQHQNLHLNTVPPILESNKLLLIFRFSEKKNVCIDRGFPNTTTIIPKLVQKEDFALSNCVRMLILFYFVIELLVSPEFKDYSRYGSREEILAGGLEMRTYRINMMNHRRFKVHIVNEDKAIGVKRFGPFYSTLTNRNCQSTSTAET